MFQQQKPLLPKGTMDRLFENLPELLRPNMAASALGLSVKTIYNWHYYKVLKEIPPTVFVKIDRILYLRRDELRRWIASLNAS